MCPLDVGAIASCLASPTHTLPPPPALARPPESACTSLLLPLCLCWGLWQTPMLLSSGQVTRPTVHCLPLLAPGHPPNPTTPPP